MPTPLKTTVHQIAIAGIFLFLLLLMGSPANASENCINVTRQIRGELDIIQSDGGIWRFMEKSTRLRDKSMLGLQIDSKLQRGVTYLENQCLSGQPLAKSVLQELQAQIDKTRSLNNKSVARTPAKKLLKMIQEINDALTAFAEKYKL